MVKGNGITAMRGLASSRKGMAVDDDAATAFAEIALRLHDEPDVEQTLEKVLEYALVAVGCDHAGVMFVHGGNQIETVAVTDPVVEKADLLQTDLGEGPCLAAIFEQDTFRVDETITDRQWPHWSSRIAQLGLQSVLGLRLSTPNTAVGALNLYAGEPNRFGDDEVAVAHILARHAAVALATARNEAHLLRAVDARSQIGQAQGILMERFELTADQAFAVLRRYSQNHNVKLNEIARRLVATRELPAPGTPRRKTTNDAPADRAPEGQG
jgi:GAF domain-containing protein